MSLLVVTEPGITTPLRQAAIFLDGVQVTRSCISNLLTRTEVLPVQGHHAASGQADGVLREVHGRPGWPVPLIHQDPISRSLAAPA